MQTIWNQVLPSSSAVQCGVIASQTKSIYISNPLQHYSYDPVGQPKSLAPPRSQTTHMKISSSNERFLALASDIVDLVDVDRGKVIRQFTEHTNSITGICNERNSPYIWATVGLDRTTRIFDCRQHPGQIACFRNASRHRCLTYSPDSQMLFCGGENILIYDIRKNLEFTSIKTVNQVLDINCHPNDCVVLGCTDDRMVKVWDIDTKECLSQSYPLESQPRKVLFDEIGNVVLACTAGRLYTCSWKPFEVISQHSWSKSKQLSKFMVMTGESARTPSFTNLDVPLTTLDMGIVDGMVMHFGCSGTSKTGQSLELRSVSIEKLLTPRENDFISASTDPISPTSFHGALDEAFVPLCNSTLNYEDPPAASIPSPLILSPTKTPTLIRKLPRSTSSSRSNLAKSPASAPKKPSTFGMSAPMRTRSSSSNALHASSDHQRASSGGKIEKKDLPPKPLCSRPSQPEAKKPVARRRSSRGFQNFDDLRASSSDFITMMKNRQTGVQRVKATILSRSNNEDEVFGEAISLPDKAAFVQLMEQLSSKAIGLKLAARILPELRFLLAHENSNFVDTSLKMLDEIVTQLKEAIRQGLSSNAQSIGVDVAAEQRQMQCIKCKKALTEIYINFHFLTAKFTEEQLLYFNSTLEKFMDFVS